jgi:hypothetical protein
MSVHADSRGVLVCDLPSGQCDKSMTVDDLAADDWRRVDGLDAVAADEIERDLQALMCILMTAQTALAKPGERHAADLAPFGRSGWSVQRPAEDVREAILEWLENAGLRVNRFVEKCDFAWPGDAVGPIDNQSSTPPRPKPLSGSVLGHPRPADLEVNTSHESGPRTNIERLAAAVEEVTAENAKGAKNGKCRCGGNCRD